MNTPFTRRLALLSVLASMLAAPLFLAGCTDLGEDVFSQVPPSEFFRTDAEVIAALAPVYANLRSTLWAYHNLSQVSSDETIVPTRGSDWFDGGRWLSMHRHTWDAGLVDLNDAWVAAYTGVARANGLLQNLEAIELDNGAELSAEIRTLRAFYYYQLMDLFGGVPIVGDEPGEFLADPENPPASESREAVYNFLVSELNAVLPDLPDVQTQYGRMTKSAANAMLANLYLNAAVFTKSSDQINTNGYNSCASTGTCQDAIDAVDRILASPRNHRLADNWFSLFSVDNANNPEQLFVVEHLSEAGLGMNFSQRYLHYNQDAAPSPWNGFSSIAETYNAFASTDKRKDVFLVGPQISFETGQPAQDRNNNPLVFTPDCGDVENTTEGACVRIAKFLPDPNKDGGDGHGNDYAFFRLGEMYLIKAEALNELGRTADAITLINELRTRVYDASDANATGLANFLLKPADYTQATLRDRILQERLFELIYEAKRRQDLVRFGKFDEGWSYKNPSQGFRVLFPIPQIQRDANPGLTQNPGY